jgi:hypothetical protein
MKKGLVLFVIAVLGVSLLAACGPKDAKPAFNGLSTYGNGMVTNGSAASAGNAG